MVVQSQFLFLSLHLQPEIKIDVSFLASLLLQTFILIRNYKKHLHRYITHILQFIIKANTDLWLVCQSIINKLNQQFIKTFAAGNLYSISTYSQHWQKQQQTILQKTTLLVLNYGFLQGWNCHLL